MMLFFVKVIVGGELLDAERVWAEPKQGVSRGSVARRGKVDLLLGLRLTLDLT